MDFVIHGHQVVFPSTGNARPATDVELELWNFVVAQRKQLAELTETLTPQGVSADGK